MVNGWCSRSRLAPAHGKAIMLPHDWHTNDLYWEVQVTCHLAEDEILLVILSSKDSHVRLHNVEELRHDLCSLHS